MLHQQAQQLRLQLGQDPLWLAAPPGIHLAFLFAELPKQFDLPAQTHQGDDLLRREHGVRTIGQYQQPVQLLPFAHTHLVVRGRARWGACRPACRLGRRPNR